MLHPSGCASGPWSGHCLYRNYPLDLSTTQAPTVKPRLSCSSDASRRRGTSIFAVHDCRHSRHALRFSQLAWIAMSLLSSSLPSGSRASSPSFFSMLRLHHGFLSSLFLFLDSQLSTHSETLNPSSSPPAAPLRLLRPRPPPRPPGSTPQSHVVGVGCRRIASAIQGGAGGAVVAVHERSGAAGGLCECADEGSASQEQRLVQRQLQGSDRGQRHVREPLRPRYPGGRTESGTI